MTWTDVEPPALVWQAFQHVALRARRCKTEELPAEMRDALEVASAVQELVGHFDSGAAEALADLARGARTKVAAARKRALRSPKSDEGSRLVSEVSVYLANNDASNLIAKRMAHAVQVSPHVRRALGLDVTLRAGGAARSLPNDEAIARAAKAITKHRTFGKYDTKRTAQACVQHALEAFGLPREQARVAVGLRKK